MGDTIKGAVDMSGKRTGAGFAGKQFLKGRIFSVVLILPLLFLLFTSSFAAARPPVRITILHVNDNHGHILPSIEKTIDPVRPVSGAAWMARMIAQERQKNLRGTLLLSGGDMFQGTALSNVFRGAPVIEIMNALNFDAMAIGNHEFDWGRDVLDHLRTSARFPFLSANVVDGKGGYLPGVKPYILLTRKGIKAAVIGITTPETAFTTKPDNVRGLTFLDPKAVLPRIIKDAKAKGARLIIVLSHSGLDADRKMAQEVSGIHVIVGGHSHTAVNDPVVVKRTIIVQAGCYGFYLGVLKITFDPEHSRITAFTRKNELKKVYSGKDDPFDPAIAGMVDKYYRQIRERFAAVAGETKVNLVRNSRGESNVGNLICDAMREAAGSDVAFQNSGGIRANIPKGKITLEQVYSLLPFDNLLISMELTGSQILRILEKNAMGDYGILQVSGLRVKYDLRKPADERVVKAEAAGRPLASEGRYRVATNDFLAAGGDAYSVFRNGKNICYGDSLRDLFAAYLKKHSPVQPEVEGRITGLE
jgi:2',3'-cyclic-nucleotide 2'-phosphodiesterase (5'-nucleotidase family)